MKIGMYKNYFNLVDGRTSYSLVEKYVLNLIKLAEEQEKEIDELKLSEKRNAEKPPKIQMHNVKRLNKISSENPNLKVIPIANGEIVASKDSSEWKEIYIDEIFRDKDFKMHIKSKDFESLVEKLADNPAWCEEYDEEQTRAIVERYNWVKVIVVNVESA